MNKIKERGRRGAALSDRKRAAAQARMKSVANLAADERVPKKRRKVGSGTSPRFEGIIDAHQTFRGYIRC